MIRQGIRISNLLGRPKEITLKDLIIEVEDGENLNWVILYLWAAGNLNNGKSIAEFENTINNSKTGFEISWNELLNLSQNLDQIYDIVLIGDKDPNLLHRYEDEQEMYEACEIVVVMFDSSYWEIFAEDQKLISQIANKIGDVEFLNSDFPR